MASKKSAKGRKRSFKSTKSTARSSSSSTSTRKSKTKSTTARRTAKPRAAAGKVGASSEAAKRFAAKGGDFGVRESKVRDRNYVSTETKMQDKGGSPGHARGEGVRDRGVGGNDSGPGSGSGGDVDADVIGVGTGGSSLSASGTINRPPGPDDSDGTSNDFAAPGPKGHSDQKLKGKVGGNKRVRGTTF